MNEILDLFVSYSSSDEKWTQNFINLIEQHTTDDHHQQRRITVFYARRDITFGSPFVDRMLEPIRRARVFLPIMTPEYFKSRWTSIEFGSAVGNRKQIIPLLRRDCSLDGERMSDLPFAVGALSYIDFRNDADFESQLALVVALVRELPFSSDCTGEECTRPAYVSRLRPILEVIESAKGVEEVQPLVEMPPRYTTLEQAFKHVADRLVWIVGAGGAPLGCAWWSARDNRLLCAAGVGKIVSDSLATGRQMDIMSVMSEMYRNEVTEVREVGLPNLAVLRVRANCWLPKPVSIAWGGGTIRGAEESAVLGSIAYEFDRNGSSSRPILARLRVEVNGEAIRLDDLGVIAPGSPIFDCSARLIGFIPATEESKLALEPFLLRQPYIRK